MGCLEKRNLQKPSTVLAIVLAEVNRQPLMCFVEPTVAARDGRHNHTVPGGGIHQLSSCRFEEPEVAIVREIWEETGSPADNIYRLLAFGTTIFHTTGKGSKKYIQPFASILRKPYAEPKMTDEIANVNWCEPSDWSRMLATMNYGKQRLVLSMMYEASAMKELFPCMKRALREFVAAVEPSFIVR